MGLLFIVIMFFFMMAFFMFTGKYIAAGGIKTGTTETHYDCKNKD
jgi:hypothetical protein